ncbi:hypothetical protein K9L97_02570 [Candidatus Woesearchaeota archaeon]|nr:hypothetical protein [Candidatus Woesearchaeota archaeon]
MNKRKSKSIDTMVFGENYIKIREIANKLQNKTDEYENFENYLLLEELKKSGLSEKQFIDKYKNKTFDVETEKKEYFFSEPEKIHVKFKFDNEKEQILTNRSSLTNLIFESYKSFENKIDDKLENLDIQTDKKVDGYSGSLSSSYMALPGISLKYSIEKNDNNVSFEFILPTLKRITELNPVGMCAGFIAGINLNKIYTPDGDNIIKDFFESKNYQIVKNDDGHNSFGGSIIKLNPVERFSDYQKIDYTEPETGITENQIKRFLGHLNKLDKHLKKSLS